MNKIALEAVLPKLPESAQPLRPESGFHELLGFSPSPPVSLVSQDSGDSTGDALQQKRISVLDAAAGMAVRMELYGLSARAQQHLSYLTEMSVAADSVGTGMKASAFPVPEKSTVLRQLVERPVELPVFLAATQGPAAECSLFHPEPDLAVADVKSTEVRAMMSAERFVAPLARRISFLQTLDGAEVAVRDYVGDTGTLVADVRQHCHDNHIPLTRIVLNGTVLWSAAQRN